MPQTTDPSNPAPSANSANVVFPDIDETMRRVEDALQHMTWSRVTQDVPPGISESYTGRWTNGVGWSAFVAVYPAGVEDGRPYVGGCTGAVTCHNERLCVKLTPYLSNVAANLARSALKSAPHDADE